MPPNPASNCPESAPGPAATSPSGPGPTVTFYHWLVVVLAACGWLFDCMGQRIFVLTREPAMRELLGSATDDEVRRWGGLATLLLMVGWATGGIVFGLVSDRYGRVRAMVITLVAYTAFSGLSGFSATGLQFLLCRFVFGLGVGGMFGAATTLIAESVPAWVRAVALGTMQALSPLGNMLASGLSVTFLPGQENLWGRFSGWQVLSFAGVIPIVLVAPMVFWLKEPEAWRRSRAAASNVAQSSSPIAELFRNRRWRRNLIVGICLGVAGMVGLWGIAFFSPELITTALRGRDLQAREIARPAEFCASLLAATNPAPASVRERLSPETLRQLSQLRAGEAVPAPVLDSLVRDLNRLIHHTNLHELATFQDLPLRKSTRNLAASVTGNPRPEPFLNRQLMEQAFPNQIVELQKTIDRVRSHGTMLQDAGAIAGMFAFTFLAARFSRRMAFFTGFALCLATVSFVFYALKTETDVYWMLPLLGFTTLSVFAGYSIYFPELFPTRFRGTGVGFCYNVVRYLAAPFPFLLGWLSATVPFRTLAVILSGIYLVGLIALVWAPETKDQPLPEG